MPIASSGLRPSARLSSARKEPSLRKSAESIVAARSGTFSHPGLWRRTLVRRCTLLLRQRQALDIARRFDDARLFAVERQPHRDTGAGAEAAADRQLAAVQRHQPLDDRQAEAGAVVRPVIGGAHLEERIADVRQI